MAMSGLVIYLEQDEIAVETALEAIAAHPQLALGDRIGRCQPAVLEMSDDRDGRRMHDWLHSLAGVHHADVVYVHFDDATASAERAEVAFTNA